MRGGADPAFVLERLVDFVGCHSCEVRQSYSRDGVVALSEPLTLREETNHC